MCSTLKSSNLEEHKDWIKLCMISWSVYEDGFKANRFAKKEIKIAKSWADFE